MDVIKSIFKNKKAVISKLIDFGFENINGVYTYKKVLSGSGFILTVRIERNGEISSQIIDPSFGELYTLHLSDYTAGSFVGEIRNQYENTLSLIAEKCFETEIFKSEQTKELIEYVRKTYSGELEFLWEKFSDNAVWRRADNKKWYGLLMTVPKSKLGIKSDETVEIIDLRIQPENMDALIDNKLYFPGWHMNKKSWYTVILDNSISTDEIKRRIDESYIIAEKK